ncbi:hypothetical protein PSEUDO8Z_60733 [Pseudomonas sp. 8Z]|nr:hypothetical protein PSEUDO8Z_60733 [Pseudomonas sp. 8Z]
MLWFWVTLSANASMVSQALRGALSGLSQTLGRRFPDPEGNPRDFLIFCLLWYFPL